MAKKKSPKKADKKDSRIGHNSEQAERDKLIKQAHRKVEEFDKKIKALSSEKSAYKHEVIKGKLGMKIADFDASHRLSKLDPDDRAIFLATIHETFTALGVGDQLDWLEAAKRADQIVEEEEEEAAKEADTEEVEEANPRLN